MAGFRLVRTAVAAAIAGRSTVDPRDAGAEQLALTYATLIDAPAAAARYTRHLRTLQAACASSEDPDAAEAYRAIAEALSRHSVTSDLGPKLLAALDALGLTTRSRATIGRKEGAANEPADPLDQLRDEVGERRARRAG